MPGPIPKRDSERIRRNLTLVQTDTVEMDGDVNIPDLDIENPHPLIVDLYESLKDSGQSKYYEPSDWQLARFCMHFANELVWSGKPSSMLLQQVNAMLSDLLVAEGQRRRVRLEVEREAAKASVASAADLYRERFHASAAAAETG